MVGGACDALFADLGARTSGEEDVDGADFTQLGQDTTRFVPEACLAAKRGQLLPQDVRQKAHENVGQHTFFFLVLDGPQRQVALLDARRGFRFGQLDMGAPQFVVTPIGHVAAQQVTAGAERSPVTP